MPEDRNSDGKFKAGASGNPGGMRKGAREVRHKVAASLDVAFTKDGGDKLVDAIVHGVSIGDSTCLKLACEYRWGKPVTQLELSGPDGAPLTGPSIDMTKLSDADFAAWRELAAKAKGDDE